MLGLDNAQLHQAYIILSVGNRHRAPRPAMDASMCAAMGESTLTAISQPNRLGYWGVLQGGSGYGQSQPNFPPPDGWNDSEGMAYSFFMGGRGFQGGGAIYQAEHVTTNTGLIATTVEDSGEPAYYYGKFQPLAHALVTAFYQGKLGAAGSSPPPPPGDVNPRVGVGNFTQGDQIKQACYPWGWHGARAYNNTNASLKLLQDTSHCDTRGRRQ